MASGVGGALAFSLWALLGATMWGCQWYFYYTVLGETTCCTGLSAAAGYGHGFCAPTSEFTSHETTDGGTTWVFRC